MSWGTELWDQYTNISTHTQKGIDFLEKYSKFVSERSLIEQDYAKQLKKLTKNFSPKKKEEDDYQFSAQKAFVNSLREVDDIAGQHEVIAENLITTVYKEIKKLVSELSQERRKLLQESSRLHSNYKDSLKQLEGAKKSYDKAFKDAERAVEGYKNADANINLSRAEVEKHKNISLNKSQVCEDNKHEYASQLEETNRAQREHFDTLLPQVFQQLQDLDERRGVRTQEFIRQTAEIERNVIPIINTCIDGIIKAADSINPQEDSQLVINRYKSGYEPPQDMPFEDLSNPSALQENNGSKINLTRTPTHLKQKDGGTVGKSDKKKRTGIKGFFSKNAGDDSKDDYSHLPPSQQRQKLKKKVDQLKASIAKETAERDGMLKMKEVYEKNPALGDPHSMDKNLDENGETLDKLRKELVKYEGYLAECEGGSASLRVNNVGNGGNRGSYSDGESLPRSNSDLSVNSQQQPVRTDVSANPEVHAAAMAEAEDIDDADGDGDLEPIGSCIARYPFDASTEGTMNMDQDEVFYIIEQDAGDGWTRARRQNGEEGYVPTSYVEITWY